jgi:hypothetical protein
MLLTGVDAGSEAYFVHSLPDAPAGESLAKMHAGYAQSHSI